MVDFLLISFCVLVGIVSCCAGFKSGAKEDFEPDRTFKDFNSKKFLDDL